jgi:hypothetical protein
MVGPEYMLKKRFPADYDKLMKEEPYNKCETKPLREP